MQNIFSNLTTFIPIAIILIAVVAILAIGYVKAPPDKALIISGLRKRPKILIAKAGIKFPFLERKDALIIKQISVDIKTNGYIPTLDFIGVDVDAVAKIRVKTDEAGIQLAMKNFLNMSEQQIVQSLTDSLQGNMREIIGTISLKEICNDRKKFGDEVQEKAQKDMNALGIEIISCNIQRVEDENQLINALGQDNMSQIQKDASVAKAQADKEVAIAQAETKQAANEAQVKAETEIAERNNELAIKKAELKKQSDIKQAEADAAYEIQKQEQRKSIEVTAANADIAKQEREVELKQKEAQVKEQELAASIKKKADAERYAAEQKAQVELYQRQKDAEARRYEEEQSAEALRKTAEAKKYASEQEAEGIRLVGEAEAAAIRAKAIAEAEGIDKKAEAMRKMGEASIIEMICTAYPQIAEAVAKPLQNVDSIVMYGEGNSAKMVKDVVNTTSQIMESIKTATGIDPQALLSGFLGGKINTESDTKTSQTNDSSNHETESKIDNSTEDKVKEINSGNSDISDNDYSTGWNIDD